jgi:osmotically-inducible protein OsmY
MTDDNLAQSVRSAFEWEPSLDASDIAVSVERSIVTLRGYVGSFAQKVMAEQAALRVYGVRAVANDIDVHALSGFQRTDTEIAQAAVAALTWNTMVPNDRVTVTIADGWLTLNGMVDWQYQREAAARTVRDLRGVKGVANHIVLQAQAQGIDVGGKIEAALKRAALIDARRIRVTANDGTVILSGSVHSWAERRQAERAAWAAPGVTQVEDRLAVIP